MCVHIYNDQMWIFVYRPFNRWVITVLRWYKWCRIIVRTAILKTGIVVVTQPPQMEWVSLTPVMSNWAVFTPDINVRFNRIYSIICSFYIVVNRVVSRDCFYMVFTQMVYECPSVIILCVAIRCDSTEFTLWWWWWPGNEINTRLLFSTISCHSPIHTSH